MNITCIKILPYTYYPYQNYRENFEFAKNILNHKINPPTNHPNELTTETNIILCSPLKRASQCLKKNSTQEVLILPELIEIPFEIKTNDSKNQSQDVRKQFKNQFINNTLILSRQKLQKQFEEIIFSCKKYNEVTLVSHTFRLILFKAFIETNGQIIKNPELIHNYIKEENKILDFGQKFTLKINESLHQRL